MQVSKVKLAANDPFLFGYALNATLANTLALAPSILVDTTASYLTSITASILRGGASDPVSAFRLLNTADDTLFGPAGAQRPSAVSIGTAGGFALRFGFGGNLSPNSGNGYLIQEQNALQNMSGSYTFGFVARRPTATELGGVNPGAGPILGSQNASGPLAGIFLNFYTGMGVFHNGSNVAGYSGGETVGTSIAYLVAFNASAGTVDIWQNGTHVLQQTGVTTLWGAGNTVLIGAALSSATSYYAELDIAGVALFPNAAFANGSAQAATVNAWLAACRANVT